MARDAICTLMGTHTRMHTNIFYKSMQVYVHTHNFSAKKSVDLISIPGALYLHHHPPGKKKTPGAFWTFWYTFFHCVSSIQAPSNQNVSNLTFLHARLQCEEPAVVFFLRENSNKKNPVTFFLCLPQSLCRPKITSRCGEFTGGKAHFYHEEKKTPQKNLKTKFNMVARASIKSERGGNADDTSSLQDPWDKKS